MDPVSHCLLGRTLNCLDADSRIGRGAAAAFVLGSIAPDADSVLVVPGWDVYLRFHEVGTHTLAGSPLVAAAVAGLVTLVVGKKGRIGPLFLAAWLGVVVGHIGFDLVSGSDIRWLAPFSADRYGWHLLAMGDVAAVGILIVGTFLTFWKRRPAAIATVAALVALLGVKAVTEARARESYTSALVARGEAEADEARRPFAINGSLFGWRFYDRHAGAVRSWYVDGWTRCAIVDFTRVVPPDSPAIDATRRLRVVRNFLALADVPFPRIEEDREGQSVFWSDVRFCDRAACGLSFGARLGADLSPIVQVIRIGSYTQTRSVDP